MRKEKKKKRQKGIFFAKRRRIHVRVCISEKREYEGKLEAMNKKNMVCRKRQTAKIKRRITI